MLINIMIVLALLAVAGTLLAGVLNMARGGNSSLRRSNLLMRWRIGLQALALVVLMFGFYLKSIEGA